MTGEWDFESEFEARFEHALLSAAPDIVALPNISSTAMASVFLDKHNHPVWTDPRLEEWTGSKSIDFDLCDEVRSSGKGQAIQTIDTDGRPILMIYAPIATAIHWPTPMELKTIDGKLHDVVAVGALSLAHLSDDLIYAARALGLTNLEARVSSALVAQGSMRRAAEKCGVTYHTARKAVAEAMQKSGISSQTQLVRKLSELATSISPPSEVAKRLLVDTFGFTVRDAGLTLLLAEGHSREQVAKIAGLSNAVAKDSFSRIFEIMAISKVPEIPRIIMDVFLVAILGDADRAVVSALPDSVQPLQLIARADGSLVAVSDFGPHDGRPVLILHSSLSTRHPFHHLIAALQAAGFRPVTIDRPGFGMSDDLPAEDDVFETGADDVKIVFERLGIDKADIVTRGGAFAALAVNRKYPNLLGQVIAINPDLLQEQCSARKGRLGVVRTGFDRFPDRVDRIARWLVAQLTLERVTSIIRMTVKNSNTDLQSFENEQHLADYQRSIMIFATGRIAGVVREQQGYATQKDVEAMPDGSHWTILLGDDDPIHDVEEILSIWKAKIPNARVRSVRGAGRFVELSHVEEILTALG